MELAALALLPLIPGGGDEELRFRAAMMVARLCRDVHAIRLIAEAGTYG